MATYNPDLYTDRVRTQSSGTAPTTATTTPTTVTAAPKPNVLPAAPTATTSQPTMAGALQGTAATQPPQPTMAGALTQVGGTLTNPTSSISGLKPMAGALQGTAATQPPQPTMAGALTQMSGSGTVQPGNTGVVGPMTTTTGAPATTAPNVLPAVPGATTSTFGPGNDLRFTQVTPGASPLTSQANSAVGSAMQALTSGPDRAALAQQMFDTFAHGTQGAYSHALTDATRMAAANGRLGSGMLTNQYGDLANQRQVQLDTAKQSFMQNALQGTIQDRLNNLGALGGIQGQLYGQDAAGRGELRDERAYQTGQSQYADQQAIQLQQLQEMLLNGAFNRQNTQAQTLGQFGFGGLPTGALQSGANYYGQQGAGALGGFGDAMSQYLYLQSLNGSR